MGRIYFKLEGVIPPKKNSKQIFVNPRTKKLVVIPSKRHKEWHKHASLQLAVQKNGLDLPIKECEYLEVILYYPDKRGRDNTNIVESVHDLLVDNGILKNDNWMVTGPTIQIPVYRKNNAGCEITIHEVNTGKETKIGDCLINLGNSKLKKIDLKLAPS